MSRAGSARGEFFVGIALLLAMCATRMRWVASDDHFGAGTGLPDASWAIFFLAGLLTARLRWPALLLASAATLDAIALRIGVSSYCVTPAYAFLLPTYLTLWAGGRWAALGNQVGVRQLARTGLALATTVTAAFLISNVSFYYLAGYFDDMPPGVYADRVSRHLPHYLLNSAMYCAVAWLSAYVWQGWRAVVARGIGGQKTKR
ncbi:MAG TPA: hypothetical protein VJS42_03010 [Steroidobacteraceae bacterium]|nr:hypothetical protein [Steroidobacteraceae bacterium]